ncbi:hypothetical protein ACW5XF_05905 [Aeromonas lusitana]|uniref:Uncharacterized protein n=1 Tax=Aeromonas lusitana TaxID=931529 RepID=A0A2M8H9N9_9GAMM|nr:hypothetical protein [Aeromonas lusitana]PJC93286.1 hypothetical protein CUC44_10085 [Aeromonas lusitana]
MNLTDIVYQGLRDIHRQESRVQRLCGQLLDLHKARLEEVITLKSDANSNVSLWGLEQALSKKGLTMSDVTDQEEGVISKQLLERYNIHLSKGY